MPASTKSQTTSKFVEFDQFIDFQVEKTRKTIKTTDLLTAGVGVMAMFLSYLLVFVVLDHWFVSGGFGIVSRWIMLGILLLLTAGWVSWKILIPYLKNVNYLYAAQSIEHVNLNLKSSLLNLVDMRRSGHQVPEEIERAIEKRAAMSLSKMNVDEAIDRRPLMRLSYVLLAVVILGSAYIVFSPKKISASLKRALFPSAAIEVATMIEITKVSCKLGRKELPPTTEMLARSRPEIHVEIGYDGEPPESVVLYYSTADQKFRDVPVSMNHVPNDQKHYVATLSGEYGQGLRQDLSYRIQAGDSKAGPYEITVVEPPSATVEKLDYEYPEYMELSPKSMMGGHIDVWEGTEVTVHAETNQPIQQATLVLLDSEDPSNDAGRIAMQIEDGQRLSVVLKREIGFRADGTSPHFYRIEAMNKNGETDPDPIVYGLTIRPDQKPKVVILIPQENEKSIPENTEELSLLTEAHDPDFKVTFLSLKSEITRGRRPNGNPEPHDSIIFHGSKKEVKQSYRWDLRPLKLKNGDVVRFRIEARDNKTPAGNRGYSRWITLKIVDSVSEEERKEQQKKDREQTKKQNPDPKQKNEEKNKEQKKDGKQAKKQGDGEGKPQQNQEESTDTKKKGKKGKDKKSGKKSEGEKKTKGKKNPDSDQQSDSSGNKNNKEKKQKSDSKSETKKKQSGDQSSPEKKDDQQEGNESQKNQEYKKDGSDDNDALRNLVEKHQKEEEQNPSTPKKKNKAGGKKEAQKNEAGENADSNAKKKKDSTQKNLSGTSSPDKTDSKKQRKRGDGQSQSPKKQNKQRTPQPKKNSKNESTGNSKKQNKSNKKLKTEKKKAKGNETGDAEPGRKKESNTTKSTDPKNLKRKKGTDPSLKKQDKIPKKVDPDNIQNKKEKSNSGNQKTTSDDKGTSNKSGKQQKGNNLKDGMKKKAKPKSGDNSSNSNTPPNQKSRTTEKSSNKKTKKSSKSGDSNNIKKNSGTRSGKKNKSNSDAQQQPGNKRRNGEKKQGQPKQGSKNSSRKNRKQSSNNGTAQKGNKSREGNHSDNQSQMNPEEADLEYGKKAANLTLDKLEDQLERGSVDKNWLKKHGWNKDDLKQFINRNRKKLEGDSFTENKMTSTEKTQFDEFLKSLKYQNRPGVRKPKNRKADNLRGVGRRGRSTPPEYREATEAFTRSLNKTKNGSKKR